MAVARNKVIDHWRKTERRDRRLHLVGAGDAPQPEPHEDSVRGDRPGARRRRLSIACPNVIRLLLMLHYVDGYTAPHLAELSGSTPAAIESALARARRAFRAHWTELEARNA